MRLSLATRVPFDELVNMRPELLATYIRAQADIARELRDKAPLPDDDDSLVVELDESELDDELP